MEVLARTVEDLKKLAEIPFQFNPQDIQEDVKQFHESNKALGDRGIMRIEYPSPIVAISATMKLQPFLAMLIEEKKLFHELSQSTRWNPRLQGM
jgi:hypothetical protein